MPSPWITREMRNEPIDPARVTVTDPPYFVTGIDRPEDEERYPIEPCDECTGTRWPNDNHDPWCSLYPEPCAICGEPLIYDPVTDRGGPYSDHEDVQDARYNSDGSVF